MTTINTYNQLINFIMENNLNVEQSKKIIIASLIVVILKDYETTEDLLKVVETFWNKWKHYEGEHPIFLENINLDVED